ncbi:hypothetical protein DL769_006310 [Monosporascus sp. CRB-8-3]|nr:hypothetical protein DL769_006310 [Monosporascus sp. CRB-8-3]
MANFSSSGLIFFIFIIIFTILCGIFLLLRLLAIRISRRSFYLDDGFVFFAYMNMVVLAGVGIWASVNGIGKPRDELTPEEIAVSAKLILASCAFLYEKVPALVVAHDSTYQLWNPRPDGHCRDMQYSDYATVGINLLLDLAILILPMPTLWALQLPVRKKVIVTVMFSFGFATIAVMLYRIILTINVRGDPDFTKHLALIGLVSGFEVWFGIIIACLPTLAPLVRPTMGKFMTGSSGYQPSGYSANKIPLRVLDGSNRTTPGRYDRLSSSSRTRLNIIYGENTQHLSREPGITTEVAYDPRNPPPTAVIGLNRIYVQSEIESRG